MASGDQSTASRKPVRILAGGAGGDMRVRRWRKRPVVVEAFPMTIAAGKAPEEWPAWAQEAWREKRIRNCRHGEGTEQTACMIETLEGLMEARWGDFIIQGVQGEIYPCKPDIFHAIYEPAHD